MGKSSKKKSSAPAPTSSPQKKTTAFQRKGVRAKQAPPLPGNQVPAKQVVENPVPGPGPSGPQGKPVVQTSSGEDVNCSIIAPPSPVPSNRGSNTKQQKKLEKAKKKKEEKMAKPVAPKKKVEPSMYGLTELETNILKQVRKMKFKIFMEEKLITLNELLKYKVIIDEQHLSLSGFPWEKFFYMIKITDPVLAEYSLKVTTAKDLKIPEEKIYVQLSDGRRYSFRNMVVNVFEIRNQFGTQIPDYPIPEPVEKSNPPSSSKPAIPPPPPPSRLVQIETALEENPSKVSKGDLIYYVSQKSANRKFDETQLVDTDSYIQRLESVFLYEKAFVDPSNYTSSAVAILLCAAPFYFHFPNFYQLNGYTMALGVMGTMMCYNQLNTLYAELLGNTQLGNILIGSTVLFYLLFFPCLNKVNHLSLFFISIAIIYTIMNYFLRLEVSQKFGTHRATYRENKKASPMTPKLEKACAEMVSRYGLSMSASQFYQYISFYDIEEKDESFQTSEQISTGLFPIIGLLVLYFLGSFLSKRVDTKILKGRDQELPISPLLGYDELGMSVVTDQCNYDLPKELNLNEVMKRMMGEIQEEVIKKKEVHHFEKTMLQEDITKNTEKYLRRFMRYVFEDYLPVFTYDEATQTSQITLTRKDNRYDMWDGSYNSVQQVLDKYSLIQFENESLKTYLQEVSAGKPIGEEEGVLAKVLRKILFLQVWNKEGIERMLNEASCVAKVGEEGYHEWRARQMAFEGEMATIQPQLESLATQIQQMQALLQSSEKPIPSTEEKLQVFQQEYAKVSARYQEVQQGFQAGEAMMQPYYVASLDEGRLGEAIGAIKISFVPNLFVELVQKIRENRKENDLEKRNEALDKVQYKFKDIYDYFTNEEVFSDHEQRSFLRIVEKHLHEFFQALYRKQMDATQRSRMVLDEWIPNRVRALGKGAFSGLLKILSTYLLFGKMIGSPWWTAKSAMGSIAGNEDLLKSYSYDGNFGNVWKWASMGINTHLMDRKILEHKDVLEEKFSATSMATKLSHYLLVALFFIIFMVVLNLYNNVVFGMVMTPMWTNLPGILVALFISFYLYYPKRWVLYVYVVVTILLILLGAFLIK